MLIINIETSLEGYVELDYYLWRNKIKQKDFARKIGIANHTVNHLVKKKTSPTLFTALKIYFETKGLITLFELLKPEDREILDKMYGIVKKDSIYNHDNSMTHGEVNPRIMADKNENSEH